MHTSTIGVVPKPHSSKFRLIIDESAGEYSLNSYISSEDAHIRLDSMRDFGQSLVRFCRKHGRGPRRLWKTDVSQAYRRLPMHFLWQIKHVLKIGEDFHVDRCNNFGGRASPKIWVLFMGLVIWIVVKIYEIHDIFLYIDDTWGFDDAENLQLYVPYQKLYPPKQVKLLLLFDALGIPHEEPKQLWGTPELVIIGFLVNVENLTITMPLEARRDLVSALRVFVKPDSRSRSLREWQRMLGWCNWALNSFSLLRPALQSSYEKLRGKIHPHGGIYLNKPTIQDLLWFADMVEALDGVHILEAMEWEESEADAVAFCDSRLRALGFWDVGGGLIGGEVRHDGFFAYTPKATPSMFIYYYEAVAVLAALDWYSKWEVPPCHLLIFSDSFNVVDLFNSLSGDGPYNDILKMAVEILMETGISLRVLHVPGVENTEADAISRENLPLAAQLVRTLPQSFFERFTVSTPPGHHQHRLDMNLLSLPPQLATKGARLQ